ncbi:MAG: esterase/lipase family protein [Candidatus Hodarchaeales archaeon]
MPLKRVAILVHGFAGKTGFMKEIEQTFNEEPYTQIYESVSNISYYDSKHGIDFSRPYDLKTPIFDEKSKQTLCHNLFNKISDEIFNYEENVSLDIFSHSMGGLVTRAMVKFLLLENQQEEQEGIWINNARIQNIFLLGTPNRGTHLAQRLVTIPADILISGLNLAMEIPRQGITSEDFTILNSQFMQMVPKSSFLKKLNEKTKNIDEDINWITIRGMNSSGILGMVWQPFLFRKIWFDRQLPFMHMGMISNDGVVNANSVPLKYAINLTIPQATHMDLLKWKSKKAGKEVHKLVKPLIFSDIER